MPPWSSTLQRKTDLVVGLGLAGDVTLSQVSDLQSQCLSLVKTENNIKDLFERGLYDAEGKTAINESGLNASSPSKLREQNGQNIKYPYILWEINVPLQVTLANDYVS